VIGRLVLVRHPWGILSIVLLTARFSGPVLAQPAGAKPFDVSAGMAEDTLKEFSRESGMGVIAGNESVAGVRTNPVRGEFSPKAALDRMLEGTGLTEAEDAQAEAFAVRRESTVATLPTGSTVEGSSIPHRLDSTVRLDPFEVSAISDKSYGAVNSNSLTAFKTELSKLPVSADVFDQAFLDDTNLGTVEQTIQFFSAGAGTFSTTPDSSAFNSQYLDRSAGTLSVRGLQAPTTMINGFFAAGGAGITGNGITSDFSLEKVEVINGPQALLYGVGGAGGVVNLTTKQARLGTPAFGSFKFQTDQYGHKQGLLDYGAGTDRVAVRVAFINQDFGGQRVFLGGPMQGDYVQITVRPVGNTVIRLTYDNETFNRINQSNGALALTAASTSNDARNGQNLAWLLATNQLGAAANGAPSGAGAIPGVDWQTVGSFGGVYIGEYRHHHQYLGTADTTWSNWLSTQLAAGYLSDTDEKISDGSVTYDAPNVTANPTGTFAVALNSAAAESLWEPTREKVLRFSALADNKFFDEKIHSQTIIGADTSRTDGAETLAYSYVQVDGNGNPVYSTSKANNLTLLPTQYWAVPNGPVQQALFNPDNAKITVGGVNYVRAPLNGTNSALIAPSDPAGLTGLGTGDATHTTNILTGLYFANFSDFFHDNLSTLFGVRIGELYQRTIKAQASTAFPSIDSEVSQGFTSFNAGVNGRVFGPVRAYVTVSDSSNPAAGQSTVTGEESLITHALGEEAGFKVSTEKFGGLSGTISVYHAKSQNETLSFSSTVFYDINPSGLNGNYNNGSAKVFVDRQSEGVQLTATAAPGNWRLRFAAATVDAKIGSNSVFPQYYNDQFNENAAGQVTYADGSVVYVAPTYNSKGVIAAPQASAPAGYIPLTVATMNNSASSYYANPIAINSQITPTSNVATVLKQIDPVHGAILTGATGLPISELQIAPNSAFPPPGTITVTQAGDVLPGSPKISFNFVGLYTIPAGIFKGLRVGGTGTVNYKGALYYYYPLGVSVPNDRTMLYLPTEALFNGILGYSHKFRRVTLSTQLNIDNLFNHYRVIFLPNTSTGWVGPNNATLDQQPRFLVWSSTIGF